MAQDAGALSDLFDNNRRWAAQTEARQPGFFTRLAQQQAPKYMWIGCADSRVSPELVFDQAPGDLFVVRVAGNFLTTDGLGSLEYGAAVLGTRVIVVLGHTSCGAIKAGLNESI